jgi:hypothetical protein
MSPPCNQISRSVFCHQRSETVSSSLSHPGCLASCHVEVTKSDCQCRRKPRFPNRPFSPNLTSPLTSFVIHESSATDLLMRSERPRLQFSPPGIPAFVFRNGSLCSSGCRQRNPITPRISAKVDRGAYAKRSNVRCTYETYTKQRFASSTRYSAGYQIAK